MAERTPPPIPSCSSLLHIEPFGIQGIDHHAGVQGAVDQLVLFGFERSREKTAGGADQNTLAGVMRHVIDNIAHRAERIAQLARLFPNTAPAR